MSARPIALLVACAASVLTAGAAAAAIAVPLDHSVRLNISGSASSVVVGNPAIADVTVVDSRTIFLSGRSPGATDVVVLDALGRTLFSGDVAVGAPAKGHVAVYRGGDKGAERSDLACDPGCDVQAKGGAAGGGSGGSAPAQIPGGLPTTLGAAAGFAGRALSPG